MKGTTCSATSCAACFLAAVAGLAIAGCAAPTFVGSALDEVPAGFELHPALRLELAAAEPVTVDPIDLAFDEGGRAFVLELPGYPDMERPARIVELTDRDGDGRWDERRLFADDLGMADSILPWRRGLLVAAPPNIVYLEDTDGDGKADRRDVLLSGFAEGNPQHNVNALRYGLDNWVHGVNGGNGARVFWPEAPEEAMDIGPDDFRVDLGARRFERTGRGAGGFGMTFGPWGRAFGTHNLDHLSQVVVPRRYLTGLPAAWQDGRLRLAAPADGGPAELFPIGVRQTRPNHPEQSSRFSAACAVTAYAGGAFGRAGLEEQGLQVFVADPSANVVHRAVVDTAGAAAAARRGRPGVEFLASTDPLFRPVNLTVGPDGALYVLDMHRGVVEHPEWIPDRMEVELDLYEGDGRGRIYRIVPAGGLPAEHGDFDGFERSRPGELLDALSHANRWRRLAAQRLLVEEFAADPPAAVVRDLREMLEDARPLGRLHALWTLSGLGQLDRESLGVALDDPAPELRRNAVLAFEEILGRDGAAARPDPDRREPPQDRNQAARLPVDARRAPASDVVALVGDPDPGVRLQAMLTAGLLSRRGTGRASLGQTATLSAVLTEMTGPVDASIPAAAARSAPWFRLAALSVLAADPVFSLRRLLDSGETFDASPADLVERLASLVRDDRLGALLADDAALRTLVDAEGGDTGRALLAGLAAAVGGAGRPAPYRAETARARVAAPRELLATLARLRRSNDDSLAMAAWRLSDALGLETSAEEVGLLDCAGARAGNPAVGLEERLQALALFGLRRHWPAASEDAALRCPRTANSSETLGAPAFRSASAASREAAEPGTRAAETVPVEGTWLERMGVLLGAEHPRPVQRAAMAELASADEEAVTAYLVERWPYLGPDARRDAGSYLIRGRSRHAALLDAIESGRIRLGEMNFILERRRFLLRSPEPDIRRRARALFDDAGVVTRADAIEAMRPALELDGDARRGEALFLELCARCHRRGGLGSGPGPDLSGIGRKSAETLLHDILDPNAAVDAAYVNYIVETTDGEVHSGLLAESAGGGIVLRAPEDLLIEVPAELVREVRSDSLSMMPEELEAGLEPADMADLLAFLSR